MALEELVSDAIQFLRVSAARKKERPERDARPPNSMRNHCVPIQRVQSVTCPLGMYRDDSGDLREKERGEHQASQQSLHCALPRSSAAGTTADPAICVPMFGQLATQSRRPSLLRRNSPKPGSPFVQCKSVNACATVRNATCRLDRGARPALEPVDVGLSVSGQLLLRVDCDGPLKLAVCAGKNAGFAPRADGCPSGGSTRQRLRQGLPPVCVAHGPGELRPVAANHATRGGGRTAAEVKVKPSVSRVVWLW